MHSYKNFRPKLQLTLQTNIPIIVVGCRVYDESKQKQINKTKIQLISSGDYEVA